MENIDNAAAAITIAIVFGSAAIGMARACFNSPAPVSGDWGQKPTEPSTECRECGATFHACEMPVGRACCVFCESNQIRRVAGVAQ